MPLEFSMPYIDIQNADVKLMELASTAGAPESPVAPAISNKLIQTDQPFKVVFEWDQVDGSMWLAGGTWHFDIYLEQMGPEEAGTSPSGGHITGSEPAEDTNGHKTFTKSVNPGEVVPGLYRVTVCQQYYVGTTPLALAMFGDIGLVRFYEEHED